MQVVDQQSRETSYRAYFNWALLESYMGLNAISLPVMILTFLGLQKTDTIRTNVTSFCIF